MTGMIVNMHESERLRGGWVYFQRLKGFDNDGQTNRQTDIRRTDICDSRVAFATEKIIQRGLILEFRMQRDPLKTILGNTYEFMNETLVKIIVCTWCIHREGLVLHIQCPN